MTPKILVHAGYHFYVRVSFATKYRIVAIHCNADMLDVLNKYLILLISANLLAIVIFVIASCSYNIFKSAYLTRERSILEVKFNYFRKCDGGCW